MAYQEYECDISRSCLKEIFTGVREPVCLLGGWAVFLTVNERFRKEMQYEYAGSRDIDLGFHVDPEWSAQELSDSAIAKSARILEDAGFTGLGSRFLMYYDIDSRKALTLEQSKKHATYQMFPLYVDLMGDSAHDDARKVLGFPLLAEPRLSHVFAGGDSTFAEEFGCRFVIPSPWILAATKLASVTNRTAGHKRHKDVSDLYAVLRYSGDSFDGIKRKVREHVGRDQIEDTVGALGDGDYAGASTVNRAPKDRIAGTIRSLAH